MVYKFTIVARVMFPIGAGGGAAALDHGRGARRQALAGAADAGALRRRARERVRAALRRGLRAGDEASAFVTRSGFRGRSDATRRL